MSGTPGNALLPGADDLADPYDVARRIRGSRTQLFVQILDRIAEQPGVRFTQLKPLAGTRNHNVVTKALDRLQREGLVEQRGAFEPGHAGYVLTGFGVAVRDEIVFHKKIDLIQQAAAHGSPA